MSQVHFKTPQVKSFFSKHDNFEYSQIAVKQDVQEEEEEKEEEKEDEEDEEEEEEEEEEKEEEALVSGDYWQVDGLRRELIRHHKDKRRNLHEMNRSETTPIPKDQFF